jgi:hypothetical protein
MNHKDLIKLAQIADKDGDVELADYLDNQLIRVSNKFTNLLNKGFDFSRKPHYNVDFAGLSPDAKELGMMTAHPTQRGKPLAKYFQAGLKDKARTPERLDQIDQVIKEHIAKVISNDPNIHQAVAKYNAGKFGDITPAERNALLGHLVNNDRVATRANDISPDDIMKVLSGKKPDVATKQITTLSNFGKTVGYGAAGAATLGTGLSIYNAKQQAETQPGSLSNPSGGPFQSMPEMGGGGMPSMGEMPSIGGGGQGGYQGPTYNMPSANESFQPMQGYQPANQMRELPRTNDQAEPLYPRITSQQAMQNAMTEDQARRYRELMDQGGRPAVAPIVGGNQEIYGPTQEMMTPEMYANPYDDFDTMRNSGMVSTIQDMPVAPVTEGTNDPNANVIYNPEESPVTTQYNT